MCYRRDDSADVAGRIYDRLVADFGKDAIYRDVDTIPFGEDFREHIRGCLSTCRVGLVVIGPDWCTIAGRSGRPRLHEATDHVRLEVEAMLARETMKTIPLFVRGAESPEPDALPEVLQPLAFRNGAEIRRDPDFHHDMDRVLAQLRRLMEPAAEKVAPPSIPPVPVAAEEIGVPIPPPETELPRVRGPAPVARKEPRADVERVAAGAPPASMGSDRPGLWGKFVSGLPGSRTWGWIWAGLSGLTGAILLSGARFWGLPFLLTLLLSPFAALAHWRDGRRPASIYAALYFATVGFALGLPGPASQVTPLLGLTQLIHSAFWAWWSIRRWDQRMN
jgi:TIR domain